MVESVSSLVESLIPTKTVFFFGAGSSLPSRAPSSETLISFIAKRFNLPPVGFTLPEITALAEKKVGRRETVGAIREQFQNLKPTGGILNLPLYNWKSLFTTNFDDLIEQSYKRRELALTSYSSNFDFTIPDHPTAPKLFKLHGTIEKDEIDGSRSRLILTSSDYDLTSVYREQLYDRLKADLAGAMLVIIGHSLTDPDIRDVVNRAISINAQAENGGRIVLFLYTTDLDRASLYEMRGIKVCFGGIDDFFAALTARQFGETTSSPTGDPLDQCPALRPVTVDVTHASDPKWSDPGSMFNGRAATHADILAGLTFERTISEEIANYFRSGESLSAILLGASGVGKTTASRQVLQRLRAANFSCWEHKTDLPLLVDEWIRIASYCKENGVLGALMVDDAHSYLYEINELSDRLLALDNPHLKLLLTATRHQWNPRIKSATLYRYGKEFKLIQLSHEEIERLLQLIDINAHIRKLVDTTFSGFSRTERRRRLIDRCEADMFVCLRSIFASESFDDIILREYAGLNEHLQEIYRHVAAMESAGVKVHRQLLVRLLRIPASTISAALDGLVDIISEYTIDEKDGIYAWRARHGVIADIVTRYKFADTDKVVRLFESVISNLRPTYDIEVRTIRELCNIDTGIPRIATRKCRIAFCA